jgi:hypothetical protein
MMGSAQLWRHPDAGTHGSIASEREGGCGKPTTAVGSTPSDPFSRQAFRRAAWRKLNFRRWRHAMKTVLAQESTGTLPEDREKMVVTIFLP